jgi:hypothetical protein
MIQLRQWPPRNSTLWRISAAFWLLNAAFNGVTACVSTTPSVYLALGGINIFLAVLSYFVSEQYRRTESLPRASGGAGKMPASNSQASELNVD